MSKGDSMKTKIIVSACLLGEKCKYNGSDNRCEDVISLKKYFDIIPVCPECFGGLPIPRDPSEIRDGRVVSKSGEDVTAQFADGAEKTLYIAKEKNCPIAVLKENSPSCGFGRIYDGTFSKTLCVGNGVAAQLLYDHDIQVFGETDVKKVLDLYLY